MRQSHARIFSFEGMTGSTAAAEILVKKQRSTSNSSESSDSMTSGRASPMSPNSHRMGSPIKMAGMAAVAAAANGAAKAVRQSGQLVEAGANGKFAVARAIREETEGTTTFFVERPLEKIEERGTESEAEEEEDNVHQSAKIYVKMEDVKKDVADTSEKSAADQPGQNAAASSSVVPGPKSFEMEDLPDENPIRCHPAFRAKKPTSR